MWLDDADLCSMVMVMVIYPTLNLRWRSTSDQYGTLSPWWSIGGSFWLEIHSNLDNRHHYPRRHCPHCPHCPHDGQVGVGVYYPSGQTTICVDARPLTQPLRPIDVSTGTCHGNIGSYMILTASSYSLLLFGPPPTVSQNDACTLNIIQRFADICTVGLQT